MKASLTKAIRTRHAKIMREIREGNAAEKTKSEEKRKQQTEERTRREEMVARRGR